MGLAGPKRRSKISADPNNTNWTRNSSSFGQRMLKQQGWEPGSYLGAKDAAHASHYTAANASHIRILLKDDNLGLGASRKKEGAETFGLDQFSGLLGRLNGKDKEVLKKEEGNRRDIKLRLWQEGRHGGIRFISAGFLVGDEVKELQRAEVEKQAAAAPLAEPVVTKKGKKRTQTGEVKDEVQTEVEIVVEGSESSSTDDEKAAKRQRKEERRQKREAKALRRQERAAARASKEERRQRKREKRQQAANGDAVSLSGASTPLDTTTAQQTSGSATPSGYDSSSASPAPGLMPRNSVRQRYIRQKRMAGLDPKALKEVSLCTASGEVNCALTRYRADFHDQIISIACWDTPTFYDIHEHRGTQEAPTPQHQIYIYISMQVSARVQRQKHMYIP